MSQKTKHNPVSIIVSRLLLLKLVLFFSVNAFAIVNMDGIHFDNKSKAFSAVLDLSVTGTSGNSDSSKATLNTQLSWITEKAINLAIFGYQYGESNSIRSVNKSFMHYRYIHKLNKMYDWELFAQLEKNEFTRLSYRGLVGTGIRYSVARTDGHHAFLGLGIFHSKEEIEETTGLTDDGVEEFNRANLYFLSKYKVKPSVSFSNSIYYQPRLDRSSDFRALLESKFDFKVNEDLSFRLKLDVEHDSEPSQSIKNTDISYMTGLVFSF